MPIARNYKEGSVIYFEGDESKEIFILKSGKVSLNSTAVDTNDEVKEEIRTGEFFGIKSVMGNYTREETAQVLQPTMVLVFTQIEFEALISKNFEILMKLLKVFSNQLRRIGKRVRELLDRGETRLPSTELFNIGEYYYRRAKKDQAIYAYKKYIEFYPTGEFFSKARERLTQIAAGNMGGPVGPAATPEPGSKKSSPEKGMEALAGMDSEEGMPSVDEGPRAPMAEEENMSADEGFQSPLEGLEGLGQEVESQWEKPAKRGAEKATPEPKTEEAPATAAVLQKESKVKGVDIAKKYYEGTSLFSQEKYEDAIKIFSDVIAENLKDEADLKFQEKSTFDKSRCLMHLNRHQDAITELTGLIKKYPKSDLVKESLFTIGEGYEALHNVQKALNFFQKVIGMPPRESINNKAKQKLEELRNKL